MRSALGSFCKFEIGLTGGVSVQKILKNNPLQSTEFQPLPAGRPFRRHCMSTGVIISRSATTWSLTLYNAEHFFHPNTLNRYSLGTKNKTLKYNPDGSLTLYAGARSPGADKESNWLPAPNGPFSLYIRAYWPEQAILDGRWVPPAVRQTP